MISETGTTSDGIPLYSTGPSSSRERKLALLHRLAVELGVQDDLRIPPLVLYRCVGGLELDERLRLARRHGEPIDLTPKQFDLLLALVRRAGEPVSKEELAREVWSRSIPRSSRRIDQHVTQLRRKLEVDPDAPPVIETVWSFGYRFCLAASNTEWTP